MVGDGFAIPRRGGGWLSGSWLYEGRLVRCDTCLVCQVGMVVDGIAQADEDSHRECPHNAEGDGPQFFT